MNDLESGWKDGTYLKRFYEWQPLPTPAAYYLQQAPELFHRFSEAATFAIECVAPFFIFGPAAFRRVAAVCFIAINAMIALAGNFGSFNLMTCTASLVLFTPLWGGDGEQKPLGESKIFPLAFPWRQGMLWMLVFLGLSNLADMLRPGSLVWLSNSSWLYFPRAYEYWMMYDYYYIFFSFNAIYIYSINQSIIKGPKPSFQ